MQEFLPWDQRQRVRAASWSRIFLLVLRPLDVRMNLFFSYLPMLVQNRFEPVALDGLQSTQERLIMGAMSMSWTHLVPNWPDGEARRCCLQYNSLRARYVH